MDVDEKYRLTEKLRTSRIVIVVLCLALAALAYFAWSFKSQLTDVSVQLSEKAEYADKMRIFSVEQYYSGYREGYSKGQVDYALSSQEK